MTRSWYLVAAATLAAATCMGAESAAAGSALKRPKISRHPNVRAEATSRRGAVVSYAPARVRGAGSVSYSKRSGSLFRLGTTLVTITARNSAGVSRSRFKVTVRDTTPPRIADTANISVAPTGATGAPVTYGPVTARDRVDFNVAVLCSPASGSVFPVGTTTVTCSARDRAGNAATSSFDVTVLPAKVGHWSGTTAQGSPIGFDISGDGRQIVNLTYGLSAPCTPSGTFNGTANRAAVSIAADGAFSATTIGSVGGSVSGTFTSTFAGRFNTAVSAAGTFDDRMSLTTPAGYQCNTGTVSWTASSVG